MFGDDDWSPLTIAQVVKLLEGAPFEWALAGGYAVELFLGTSIREHEDIDILIFRDEQHAFYAWLADWHLYASDPPGTLREWKPGEWLAFGIHDVWGYEEGAQAWQLQVLIVETEGDEWFNRRDSRIRGPRHTMIGECRGVPCIPIEIQLLYKARSFRDKDRQDFFACLPLLDQEAKRWLQTNLALLVPQHEWLELLEDK